MLSHCVLCSCVELSYVTLRCQFSKTDGEQWGWGGRKNSSTLLIAPSPPNFRVKPERILSAACRMHLSSESSAYTAGLIGVTLVARHSNRKTGRIISAFHVRARLRQQIVLHQFSRFNSLALKMCQLF